MNKNLNKKWMPEGFPMRLAKVNWQKKCQVIENK
jgi:hypothetical protein